LRPWTQRTSCSVSDFDWNVTPPGSARIGVEPQ
jgi:hypothetical protein